MASVGQNILSQNYDDFNKKLTIFFLSGGKYEFENVSYDVYEGLLNAKHKQTYFDQNIKGKFNHTKIY